MILGLLIFFGAFVQILLISKVQNHGGNARLSLIYRPTVRTVFFGFDRYNRKPVMLPSHGIFVSHNLPVILAYGLTRPYDFPVRIPWKIDVQQPTFVFVYYLLQCGLGKWLQSIKVRFVFPYRNAQGDTAYPEQHRLPCRGKGTGMPGGVAQVRTDVDTG